jgi:two-component system NtrC family sensor kinase
VEKGSIRRHDMATRNKSMQNKPQPTSVESSEKDKPLASADPSVELFIVQEESIDHVAKSAATAPLGLPKESARRVDYTPYKILFENEVAEVSARVAQELNAPLATILVYTQLLLARGTLDEVTKQGVETIYRVGQQASSITTNLISFARRGKPEKQLISIQEVIQKSLGLHIPRLMANNIEVVVKLQPDIPNTMADPYQMQQVFANIITNAEQAMIEAHGKGRLYLKAQKVWKTIRITFEDDGPGIPQHNIERIFEPFFTTKDAGKGLGLGLSICSGIIESHNGKIYAMSGPAGGATFVVEIPILA